MKSLFLEKLNILEKIHSQLRKDNDHTKHDEIELILNDCMTNELNNNTAFNLDLSICLFLNSDIFVTMHTIKLINKFISLCNQNIKYKNADNIELLLIRVDEKNKLKKLLDIHCIPIISLFLQIRNILLQKTQEKIDFMYSQCVGYDLRGFLIESHIPNILRKNEYESFMAVMYSYELYYIGEDYIKISLKKDIIDNYIHDQVVEKIQVYFPDFFLSDEELEEINILIPYFAEHVDQIWNALSEKIFHVPKYMWNLIKKKYDV